MGRNAGISASITLGGAGAFKLMRSNSYVAAALRIALSVTIVREHVSYGSCESAALSVTLGVADAAVIMSSNSEASAYVAVDVTVVVIGVFYFAHLAAAVALGVAVIVPNVRNVISYIVTILVAALSVAIGAELMSLIGLVSRLTDVTLGIAELAVKHVSGLRESDESADTALAVAGIVINVIDLPRISAHVTNIITGIVIRMLDLSFSAAYVALGITAV